MRKGHMIFVKPNRERGTGKGGKEEEREMGIRLTRGTTKAEGGT